LWPVAFSDDADSLLRALLGQVDQVLSHIWMPIQVADDIGAAALSLRPVLQLLVEVGMPLQVRVDGITHGLIAWGRVGHWQRNYGRGRGRQQSPGENAPECRTHAGKATRGSYA
jgi:hypothetical protein